MRTPEKLFSLSAVYSQKMKCKTHEKMQNNIVSNVLNSCLKPKCSFQSILAKDIFGDASYAKLITE